ncbi:MAG TPA: 4Fe-4S binding protein, partial [Roseiflexaceae bacterium]|nr:4Fe-4S binding protein [Roseiflexaceae bacterium]
LVLKDNRAFCKYACPITVLLKLGAPVALLNVRGDRARCCRRRVCESICPMDVRIAEYLEHDQRISSSECILCQACIHVCPEQALTLSLGADGNRVERLRSRDQAD